MGRVRTEDGKRVSIGLKVSEAKAVAVDAARGDMPRALCYYRIIGTEEHGMIAQDLDTLAVFVMIAGTISVVGLIVVVELGFAALAAWDWWRG